MGHPCLFLAAVCLPAGVACDSAPIDGSPSLAHPHVVMKADPAPPFTYWAPEDSTISKHPVNKGVWVATTAAGDRHFYFGDQCRASAFQHLLGKSIETLPDKPADADWRTYCTTCLKHDDLKFTRMNVSFDQSSGVIHSVTCG